MLTVTNNLSTHLVIPRGMLTGKSLMLPPKGTAQVAGLTEMLQNAERNGQVTISAPGGAREEAGIREAPTAGPESEDKKKPAADPRPDPEEKGELLSQILVLVRDGKTQQEIAKALGTNRSVVQKALRRAGMERKRSKKRSKK